MGAIESILSAFGLKKAVVLAGALGGAISGALLPGPLALLEALWLRVVAGAAAGSVLAGFGAQPVLLALEKPDSYLQGVALGIGLVGLSFVFKVAKAWNDFDLSAVFAKVVDKFTGRIQ